MVGTAKAGAPVLDPTCERPRVRFPWPTHPTIRVLAPGLGRTKTGRLWVYVRDDRPFCGAARPEA